MKIPTYVHFTTTNGIPTGFCLSGKKYSSDLLIEFEPKENETYYLLCVEYTYFDSETTTKGNFNYVEMYETFELADENAKRIRIHQNVRDNDGIFEKNDPRGTPYIVNLKLPDGSFRPYHGPWIGAMERPDRIFVVALKMNAGYWEY